MSNLVEDAALHRTTMTEVDDTENDTHMVSAPQLRAATAAVEPPEMEQQSSTTQSTPDVRWDTPSPGAYTHSYALL